MHLNALLPEHSVIANICVDVSSEKLNLICRELARPGAVAEWGSRQPDDADYTLAERDS